MGIFDRIKDAIFGHSAATTAGAAARPAASNQQPTPPAASTTPPAAPATQTVDIEAVLNSLAAKHSEKLNWRTSIVDLMKLVGLDSSLSNRQALAKELGYSGNPSDSASMNIWLHKEVMNKLAQNGGKVPAELR